MVVGNASSPKRRRTDDAQAAADTNATLHMFTSNNKRYQWMQAPGSYTQSGEGATGYSGNGNWQEGTRAGDVAHLPDNPARPSNTATTRLPPLDVNTPAAQPSTAQCGLVGYKAPSTSQVPTSMTAAAAVQSRPPSSATTPHPSLPSPAPSEDHVGSPGTGSVVIEDSGSTLHSPMPVKRGRGRPRKYPLDSTITNTATARSRNNSMQANAIPLAPSQRTANMRNLPPSGNFAPSNLRTNTIAHQSNAALAPQHVVQPSSPSRSPCDGGLYNMGRMQQRMNDFFVVHELVLTQVDVGRRTLLQEALKMEDFFYLTLSQVFCLRTCAPHILPRQLERVEAASWSFLEKLLCSNMAMNPLVAKFFSEFPAPIHIILASGESQFFMNQLIILESFLQELPRRWDHIMDVSKRRLAPPLTEEMVEELYLISPVVQTTAFRAIARSFWGEDNSGLRFLESLHKFDQHTYTYQQWKRNRDERTTAAKIYAQVFTSWRSQRAQRQSSDFDFSPPAACDYFKQPPQSVLRNPSGGASNGHRQYSRGAAHQLQMMDVNQRILAQQRAIPGFTAEQQQQVLQSNNRTIPQQGLPPTPLQHLQYPPVQRHAPQPGTPHNQMLLPQNRVQSLQHAPRPQMAPHQNPNLVAPNLPRLLPPGNAEPRPLPVQPDTARVSLHQAHLRSPIPGYRKPIQSQQPLYRHVTGFAMAPTPLDKTVCSQTVSLTMSQPDFENVPITTPAHLPGEPNVRLLTEGSILYRLRCSKVPPGKGFDSEASWVTAENVWPESICFQLNGVYLEARRKLHYGRYLPIDLTYLLHAGTNTLNVYSIPSPHDPHVYAVAIERVSASSHALLLSGITPISANDSLKSIEQSLSSGPGADDDDIVMTSSALTIPLFDPYRGDRVCTIPVRGPTCSHRACFDLETFLSQCKREQPGYPCVPDCWRCPLCRGDVRPQTLVSDGFLMQVREELDQRGLLGTRDIIVEADGSWRPKAEEKPMGVRSQSLEREEAAAAVAAAAAATTDMNAKTDVTESGGGKGKAKVTEVIELD